MLRRWFKPERPFDVRRWPGYYGWVILVVGTLGMVAAVPGSPPGMAVFVDGMIESLGLSRAQFALAYTCGTIAAGVAAPFAGRLIDRLGARAMGCISFSALGVVLLFTGLLDRIHASTASIFPGSWWPFGLVLLAFAGIRLTGVSFGMTTCRSMVFRWFESRRGWAAGINGVVLSLSFSSAPLLLNGIVLSIGWQRTWMAIGLLFIFGMSALAYVFFRDSPERCAVPVERAASDREAGTRVPVLKEFRSEEAIRTRTFWIFVSGLALNALIGTGISFHIVAVAAEKGLSRAEAVSLFLPAAVFHIGTTLGLGAIVERIKLKCVLMLMVSAQAVSLLGVANVGEPFWRWFYIAGSGIGWGAFGILINVPWPRFYGRRYLGAINGWVTGATVVTSALGPYFFGLSNAWTGSFLTAFIVTFALCPLVLSAAAIVDNPQTTVPEGAADPDEP